MKEKVLLFHGKFYIQVKYKNCCEGCDLLYENCYDTVTKELVQGLESCVTVRKIYKEVKEL